MGKGGEGVRHIKELTKEPVAACILDQETKDAFKDELCAYLGICCPQEEPD